MSRWTLDPPAERANMVRWATLRSRQLICTLHKPRYYCSVPKAHGRSTCGTISAGSERGEPMAARASALFAAPRLRHKGGHRPTPRPPPTGTLAGKKGGRSFARQASQLPERVSPPLGFSGTRAGDSARDVPGNPLVACSPRPEGAASAIETASDSRRDWRGATSLDIPSCPRRRVQWDRPRAVAR